MSLNTDQSKKVKPSPKSTRGRKRRVAPNDLDPTGRNHFMVLEKQRMAEKGAGFKEEQRLFNTVEKSVSIVEHTAVVTINIERQELALMVILITNKSTL